MVINPKQLASKVSRALEAFWEEYHFVPHGPKNPAGRTTAVGDAVQESAVYTIRHDRKSVINDAKRMSIGDPRVAAIVGTVPSDATVGGFEITMKTPEGYDPTIAQLSFLRMESVRRRLRFVEKAEGWARRMTRDGDLFGQLIVDESTLELVDLKVLDASITHPNKDNRGNWKEGAAKAYYQVDEAGNIIQYFAEWEVVHVKWQGDDDDVYGQSQWRAARKSYHILDRSEEDLAIRRRTRTGLKRFHQVEGSWSDVEEYKKNNKETLSKPFDVTSDFFGNKATNITELQGDQGISDLGDIQLFLNNLFVAGRFPKALLGFEADIAGDLLELQLEQYYRYLWRIEGKLTEFLRGIFKRVLLFAGIPEEAVSYEIQWASKTIEGTDAKIARAHTLRMDGAICMETYHKIASVPGVDWATEKEKILAEMEDFPMPPFSMAMGRPFVPMSTAELMALYPTLFGLPDPNAPAPAKEKAKTESLERRLKTMERELNELKRSVAVPLSLNGSGRRSSNGKHV